LNKNGKIVEPHFVKNDVLNILKEYKELTSEEKNDAPAVGSA